MKKHGLITAVGLLLLLCLTPAAAGNTAAAGDEWRSFWVVRGSDLLSEDAIDRVIAAHKRMGFNAAVVQVNGRFEAYYRSDLVPQAPGVPENFDPLAYFLNRAHQDGIAVHAWINALTASPFGYQPEDSRHVITAHPDWATYNAQGQSVLEYRPDQARIDVIPAVFLEPGLPEVQTFVVDMVAEVASRYPVDGIHLDYMRYPTPSYGFHPYNRYLFELAYGIDPLSLQQRLHSGETGPEIERLQTLWNQFRSDHVTNLMRQIYWRVKAIAPDMIVSAAVVAELDGDFAQTARLQNWPLWMQEGVVDLVFPMAYSPDPEVVLRQLRLATAVLGSSSGVVAGLGAYQIDDPLVLTGLIGRLREEIQPRGFALFSYGALRDNVEYLELLQSGAF